MKKKYTGVLLLLLTLFSSNTFSKNINVTILSSDLEKGIAKHDKLENRYALIANCQDITVQLDASGNATITPADINDGTSVGVLTLDRTTFDCSDIGTPVIVTLTASPSGDTCTALVTVEDNFAPVADAASLSDITAECEVTSLTAPTATDNCGGTVTVTNDATLPISGEGSTTVVTWTYDDGNGNTSTQTQNIIIDDVTAPTTPSLPVVSGQCSATATIPTTTDNCSGTINGTTTDPLTYNSQGSYIINWTFDDGNGNSIVVPQSVVVNDTTDPIAVCQSITIALDPITGIATVDPSLIDNGSTDNCGNVNLSLSQTTFNCLNSVIGPNTVTLTVSDGNGNSDTCIATINIVDPNVSGGTLVAYLTDTETTADADDIVEVTACPFDTTTDPPTPATQSAEFTLTGYSGVITSWESSIDGGLNWVAINNTSDTYTFSNITQTTLIRALSEFGPCPASSTIVRVVVIPPDVPPTIVGPDEFIICLGDSFTVEAESSFGVPPLLNQGGQFNQGNLPGWRVDGLDGVSGWNASGSNSDPTGWRGISNGNGDNGSNITEGVRYKNQGGNKFAISYGNFATPSVTTLETPVFNTLGLTTASLDFQSAYYIQTGAIGTIELSLDGGNTYPISLMSFTGPGNSGGFINAGGGANNVPTVQLQDAIHSNSIDLSNYLGLTNLRIQFKFTSTAGSSWAIDGITIPDNPVDEVIEWTDQNGFVVTTGSTTSVTPITPGVQEFGVTSLINGCRSLGDEGTVFVDVEASLAYAGINIDPTAGECGKQIVNLKAYDNTQTAFQNHSAGVWEQGLYIYPGESYDHDGDMNTPNIIAQNNNHPGTGITGAWTVVNTNSTCGGNYSFSNPTNTNPVGDPRANFTADPGTYTLRWTLSNGCFDEVEVTIDSCDQIDFDGTNDYVSFGNNYGDLGTSFSIEAWVKPNGISGTHTIISKRRKSNTNRGYDLSLLSNGRVQFNWYSSGSNDGTIESQYTIDTTRWYHIAVTFNGTYNLYIDGIDVGTISGTVSPPESAGNNHESLLGAIDTTNSGPTDYFNGWIDEVRIWNTAISQSQIRQMMNQEIIDNTAVRGEVVPLDIPGLLWSNLDGYYRMDITCGKLTSLAGASIEGQLRNMNSSQLETAPLPYTSRVDGQNWSTDNTWTNFSVWDAPNSIGIDGITPIDWNIVKTSHDITSGDRDIIVLGLISDTTNKELTIADPLTADDETNDGQALRVTHYLKLDGNIDLVGESQLLQDEGSIIDNSSSGTLERDQQGTTNRHNYNYWSSPVTTQGSTNLSPYAVSSVLRDGTNSNASPLQNINWIGGVDANATSNPISLAEYWLWSYDDEPENSYSDWHHLQSGGLLKVGLGFTMKGSDASSTYQNYVFEGKPNNGTITNTVSPGYQTLVGNPYPSAIDANEFIIDNGPSGTNSIDGVLYFWEHFVSNNTHILEAYEGGYAGYNLVGGVPPYIPTEISGSGTFSKTPGQFVPVSQGFFVTASTNGGDVNFYNSQRVFRREATGTSVFMEANNNVSLDTGSNNDSLDPTEEDLVKRIRLDFTSPDTYMRQLLLGFVTSNEATDGLDYGYDALVSDIFENDMSWVIEDDFYSIQGVGEFTEDRQFPLAVYLVDSGTIKISLNDIENFDEAIDVYIYDSLSGNYTQINDTDFEIALDAGDYMDRFYLTFNNQDQLSNPKFESENIIVNYLNETDEIYINTQNRFDVKDVYLINMLGQIVISWNDLKQESDSDSIIRMPARISSGNYIIKVHTRDGKAFNQKVVVKD